MLYALNELTKKSQDLYKVLQLQFQKNAKLAAAKTMEVTGSLAFKPKIDDTDVPCPQPEAPPKPPCNCDHGLTLAVSAVPKQ